MMITQEHAKRFIYHCNEAAFSAQKRNRCRNTGNFKWIGKYARRVWWHRTAALKCLAHALGVAFKREKQKSFEEMSWEDDGGRIT